MLPIEIDMQKQLITFSIYFSFTLDKGKATTHLHIYLQITKFFRNLRQQYYIKK